MTNTAPETQTPARGRGRCAVSSGRLVRLAASAQAETGETETEQRERAGFGDGRSCHCHAAVNIHITLSSRYVVETYKSRARRKAIHVEPPIVYPEAALDAPEFAPPIVRCGPTTAVGS